MNKRHTIEQRFEYSIKPLELGFLLISSPIALFAGWIGMSPLFRSPPYTINLNGDIITGTHAVSLSIIFIFFSIAWLAFTAFAYRQRKLCSKEVVLGETKINLPLTVAGEVDKSLTYEELLGALLHKSLDGIHVVNPAC